MIKKFLQTFKDSYIQNFDDRKFWKDKPVFNFNERDCFPMVEFFKHDQDERNRQGVGIFFTPNPCKGGRAKENVTSIEWVFTEIDDGSKAEQMKRIESASKKPTMIIESLAGYHLFWKCHCTDNQFEEIEKGLVYFFNGDPACKDKSRVFRFPNMYHNKFPNAPFKIKLLELNDGSFNPGEMLTAFPEPSKKWKMEFGEENDDVLKNIPIKQVLDKFNAQYNRKNELLENGEVTSAVINVKENYINRFSGKPPCGSNIDVVKYYLETDNYVEAAKWLRETFNLKKSITITDTKESVTDKEWRATWGTYGLDHKFGLLRQGKFCIFGGYQFSGKTTYCFDMAMKQSRQGHKVLFITVEMSTEDMLDNIARNYAGIEVAEEYDIAVPKEKLVAYENKIKELKALQGIKLMGLRENMKKPSVEDIFTKSEDYDIIYVDNLGDIAGEVGQSENDKYDNIIHKLKAYTGKTKKLMFIIHHIRKPQRGYVKPTIHDLRGSGKIADGGDYVVIITRNPDPELDPPYKYLSELLLEKVRGYDKAVGEVYFNRGTFQDEVPGTPSAYIKEIFKT